MTELVRKLLGYVVLRVNGASPETAANRLARARIPFWGFRKPDEFTCLLCVRRRDGPRALALLRRAQLDAALAGEYGAPRALRFLKRRRLFLLLAFASLAAVFTMTRFVWFLRVEGNVSVPSEQILRELADLGVGFGTPCSSIVPQDLKNRMLVRIPALGWLTVNRAGGVATVVVREREPAAKIADRLTPTNLIASRAGLLTDVSVLSGYPACEKGQTVRAGQLLVSGYADYGCCTHACRAIAEVYARTWRPQNVLTPDEYGRKSYTGRAEKTIFLLLGRKRIKISGNSGIPSGECDKMTVYRTLTLPGGYGLPVRLETQTAREYELAPAPLSAQCAGALLREGAERSVRADMTAGEILREKLQVSRGGGTYRLGGWLECREMIARTVRANFFEGD